MLAQLCTGAGLREYTAQEAKKHIGEIATVVGKVDCIDHGRRHVDLQIGGCDLRKALLWIVVPDEASGPELDPETVRDVQVAVTGKIESASGTPQITIRSTTQIQPRTALQTNYIGHAYDKEQKGDIDGAIADLNKAIEHQLTRRDEACQHLGALEAKRGDWQAALAAYDRLIAFDPNKADSYWVRATAKEQHGDFEGAMADFTRAAELRSSGANFIEIGNRRKAHGDLTGATATYDKAIAMLDSQIAGTTKPSDRLDLLFYQRGYTKELKGDLDGAVSDYNQAIAIKPTYAAGAFSRRGDIKKSHGDFSGAIADYQHAVQYAQLDEDKEKLKKARAEAKTGAKNVATQPNIQATQTQQSFNKSAVTPESIPEAFVEAYSGADVDALAGLYADRVDYTSSGVISNAAVRAEAEKYFTRWPVRQWRLAGQVNTIPLGTSKKKVIFSATYDASDPQTKRHVSGIAQETLILAADPSGALNIVSQKEQTSKRRSSQPSEETAISGPGKIWSEASPDKTLLATIRFVPNPDQNCRACDELKITVFRAGRDGKPGQILASTALLGCFLQSAHWSPDSQFLLFTTSLSRGAHGGGHYRPFVYCAGDRSLRDVEDAFGDIIAPDFRFESPDIAVLTIADENAPKPWEGEQEQWPSKQVKVSLGKVVNNGTQIIEKSASPDGKFSVEVVRTGEDSLVLSKGGAIVSRIPTQVGPEGSFFQTLWSPEGKYVAINKQRSSRPGGDEMWILVLPTGKVLRQPDDALWNELEEKASAFIPETRGKEFLTLTAIGWEKDRLRFGLEAWFSEIEDRYVLSGLLNPSNPEAINDLKVSRANAAEEVNHK
jgi:tetratricopeptide (TPR) repeat protein